MARPTHAGTRATTWSMIWPSGSWLGAAPECAADASSAAQAAAAKILGQPIGASLMTRAFFSTDPAVTLSPDQAGINSSFRVLRFLLHPKQFAEPLVIARLL